MTWTSITTSFTPSWASSGATTLTFTEPSTSFSSGNWNRFIDADPIQDSSGGVDFNTTVTTENPAQVTVHGSATVSSNRNDPV